MPSISRLPVRPLATALLALASLPACSQAVKPPGGAGVCWRMFESAGRPPSFRPIAREIANLESCAVQLEGTRMLENRPVTGAYAGRFIFATEAQISSADRLDGHRFRVFEPEHRAEVQAGLRKLIELRAAEGNEG